MSTALDGTKKMALRSSLETMAGEVLDRNQRIAALEAEIERKRTALDQEVDAHNETRAEIERLRAALRDLSDNGADLGGAWCAAQAQAALAPEQQEREREA